MYRCQISRKECGGLVTRKECVFFSGEGRFCFLPTKWKFVWHNGVVVGCLWSAAPARIRRSKVSMSRTTTAVRYLFEGSGGSILKELLRGGFAVGRCKAEAALRM